MARCPDHARELTAQPNGTRSCPQCQGSFLNAMQAAQFVERLKPETRAVAAMATRTRQCPDCKVAMNWWRIGTMEAWVDRCPSCEGSWLDASDFRSLKLLEQSALRQAAWQSLPESERQEVASAIAKPDDVPSIVEHLTGADMVMSFLGLPLVAHVKGDRFPLFTPVLAALLTAVYLGGLLMPELFGFRALAWAPRMDVSWPLVTSMGVHGGLFHLLGNLAVLWVYGSCVERRIPSWAAVVAFLLGGVAATLVQGAFSALTTLIGGASGGIAVFMGLAVPLQPQARLKIVVAGTRAIPVPLWFGFVAQSGFQLLMASLGVPGIAWYAHLTGLLLGFVGGQIFTRAFEK